MPLQSADGCQYIIGALIFSKRGFGVPATMPMIFVVSMIMAAMLCFRQSPVDLCLEGDYFRAARHFHDIAAVFDIWLSAPLGHVYFDGYYFSFSILLL